MAADQQTDDLTSARINDAEIMRGAGGETHQVASGATPILTT